MIQIGAVSFGPELPKLLSSGKGNVLAVLSRAIYLESSEGYVVAVVGDDAVDGPLTLRVRNVRLGVEAVRGRRDLAFTASRGQFDIGGLLMVSMCEARAWEAVLPGCLGDEAARQEAASVLVRLMAASAPGGSFATTATLMLAGIVCGGHFDVGWAVSLEPQPATPSLLTARRLDAGVVRFIHAWRAGDADGAGGALVALLGLGAGLTPSGDDIVSGVLAALVWRSQLDMFPQSAVEPLAKLVRESSPQTNRISARLLDYASRGILYAPAMQLGAALLAGVAGGVEAPARHLFTIGNTTGLDLAGGLLVGILA